MKIDMTGVEKGWLKVLCFDHRRKRKGGTSIHWKCLCRCGNEFVTETSRIRSGQTQSCGCYQKKRAGDASRTHGDSKKPGIHASWRGMKERCQNPNHYGYKWYGGRGISVCEEWQKYEKFKEDMGSSWSHGMTIDRIDVNGNYEPSNCKWSTSKEQSSNTRRNRKITLNGATKTLGQWCAELGIERWTPYNRMKRGWSVEEAFLGKLSCHE